jgi:hypothetical protein
VYSLRARGACTPSEGDNHDQLLDRRTHFGTLGISEPKGEALAFGDGIHKAVDTRKRDIDNARVQWRLVDRFAKWCADRRRQYFVFGLLAFSVTVLCVDLQGLLTTPRDRPMTALTQAPTTWQELDDSAKQLIEKQYETAAAEIRLRIEQENVLFGFKFVLVGGTLFLLLQRVFRRRDAQVERTAFTALVAWAAVVATAIVDLRMMANQSVMTTLGAWVRQYEKLRLGSSLHLGWETFLAEHLVNQSFYPALHVSARILTVLLFAATGFLFLLSSNAPQSRSTAGVTAAGALSTLLLMTAAVTAGRDGIVVYFYISVALFAASLVGLLAYGSSKPARYNAVG